MNETLLLFGVIMAGMVALGIAAPLFAARRQVKPLDTTSQQVEEQLGLLVNGVRDLDFDFDTGKVSEADYLTQRKLLIGRGVSTLIRLDETRQHEDALDDEIEKLVAAYRQNG